MLVGYRTIISATVAIIGELLRRSGVEIDQEGVTNSVMILGGAAAAIYFRIKAKPKA